MSRPTCVVVLAAGEGSRMMSSRPKPLHQLCGRAMISYVLDAVVHDDVLATVVVVGRHATWVEKEVSQRARASARVRFVEQSEQLGTGHAVAAALASVDDAIGESDGDVVIVPSDTPLLQRATIAELIASHRLSGAALTVLSARVDDPTGYGRLIFAKDGTIGRIVEERDATSDERAHHEVNTSIMVVRQSLLGPALRRVDRRNAQHEYYLTDLVAVLHDMGHLTQAHVIGDANEALGVNDRSQLARAEAVLRERLNEQWMARGVTMWDPSSTYIDADVELSEDVTLLPGTVLKGSCVIARGARIGPHAYLVDVDVGAQASVGTVEATNVRVGAEAKIGSFVVLRPGTNVAGGTTITSTSELSN